jgi:uncharacterized protein
MVNKINNDPNSVKFLQDIYDASINALADEEFNFQLLLPAESESLRHRAESLGLWCQGYLTALNLMNVRFEQDDAQDINEAINDLLEIAKMSFEQVVDCEEDEEAYSELVEYVRVAVMMIYEEKHQHPVQEGTIPLH